MCLLIVYSILEGMCESLSSLLRRLTVVVPEDDAALLLADLGVVAERVELDEAALPAERVAGRDGLTERAQQREAEGGAVHEGVGRLVRALPEVALVLLLGEEEGVVALRERWEEARERGRHHGGDDVALFRLVRELWQVSTWFELFE